MRSRSYQKIDRYFKWYAKIEKNIVRLTVILFLVLYASQLINFVIQQRGDSLLSEEVESLEGKSIALTQTQLYMGTIELRAIGQEYSNLQVFINGDYYTNFNKNSLSLTVKNNDIIEINGIKNNYPAKVEIINKSQNVIAPEINTSIDINKDFVIAGRVQLK